MLRKYNVNIDFGKNLDKVIKPKAYFNEKDRFTSVFLCHLKMNDKIIDITDCTVSADVMVNEGDYKTAVCLETTIVDAKNGIVAFGLAEELMTAGTKRFQIHINHKQQIIHSPMVEYTIFKGL